MNIEKLVRHLKEFTLDEIEMIAECDCKTELERLLNEGKIVFKQGLYKYIEKDDVLEYGIFATQENYNPQLSNGTFKPNYKILPKSWNCRKNLQFSNKKIDRKKQI